MDDGDGAFPVELMAGQPDAAVLQTIYNGSSACAGCGGILSPVLTLFAGGVCPECQTRRSARAVKQLTGR